METLNILHLSDFHIGNFRYDDPKQFAIKASDILEENGRKVDLVIVSGDVFDGRSKNEDRDRRFAIVLFDTLVEQLILKEVAGANFDRNSILFVPGNHDLKREVGAEFSKYDLFWDEFYKGKSPDNLIWIGKHNYVCSFPEKKIAIVGLNSCRVEVESIKSQDLSWIDELSDGIFGRNSRKIKDSIRNELEAKRSWDDFGYVNVEEMDRVFVQLRKTVPNYHEFNVVAVLHHHFYPFPEVVRRYPDSSFVRNYTDVMDKFQRYPIKVVLHGHKHLSIQRAVTDNRYFDNPDSIIYVLAAGSVGCKDVYTPSFQWIRVFEGGSLRIAEGERYDFKDEELASINRISLPPQKRQELGVSTPLLESLEIEDPSLFEKYQRITDEFEQLLQNTDIQKVIESVGDLLTVFEDIKMELRKNPALIYTMLLVVNFRVVFLKNLHQPRPENDELLSVVGLAIRESVEDARYASKLMDFLILGSSKEMDKRFPALVKGVATKYRRMGSYCAISVFFTDLLQMIGRYGEQYFNKEGLNHKINVRLGKDLFDKNIPSNTIEVEADVERRAVLIEFKCKEPTTHKVAVMIVKDFELRLGKIEDCLKEIRLKLYYILPKVNRQNYDLENFHFDAYIPTLLPLLTGDNLYKQKEVFIRELVQNSIDATLLRKKLDQVHSFDSTIRIQIGSENRGRKKVKYFKIIDNGTGMSRFTIERYFTSIGRSYYVSDEFDELKNQKAIKYNPISNFGIGFLSSFMVCQEILVKTRSIFEEESLGLEIEIPNYEGCFFIRNVDRELIGTEITLYEDSRKLFRIDKFLEYTKKELLGLPLDISVEVLNSDGRNQKLNLPAYSIQKRFFEDQYRRGDIVFFVPFEEDLMTTKPIPWEAIASIDYCDEGRYGLFVNFSRWSESWKEAMIISNQGLLVSEPMNPRRFGFRSDSEGFPVFHLNFPSSFLQLDVAREKVVKFKVAELGTALSRGLRDQILDFLRGKSDLLMSQSISRYNLLVARTISIIPNSDDLLKHELFGINLDVQGTQLEISFSRVSEPVVAGKFIEIEEFCSNFMSISSGFKEIDLKSASLKRSSEFREHFPEHSQKLIDSLWRSIRFQKPSLGGTMRISTRVAFEKLSEELVHYDDEVEGQLSALQSGYVHFAGRMDWLSFSSYGFDFEGDLIDIQDKFESAMYYLGSKTGNILEYGFEMILATSIRMVVAEMQHRIFVGNCHSNSVKLNLEQFLGHQT